MEMDKTRTFARTYDIPFVCSQVLKPFLPLSPRVPEVGPINSDLAKWILDPKLPSFMALLAAVRRPDGSRLDAEEYLSVGPNLIDASESCKMTLEAMTAELELNTVSRFAVSTPDLLAVKDNEEILMKFFPFEEPRTKASQIDEFQPYGRIYKRKADGRFGASILLRGKWTSIGSGYVIDTGPKDEVEIVVEAWGRSTSLEKFKDKEKREYSLERDEMVECYTWDEEKHEMTHCPVRRPFLTLGVGEYADSMPYHYDEETNPFPKFPTKHIGKKVLMVKLGPRGTAPAVLAWVPCKEKRDVYQPRLLYVDDCFVVQGRASFTQIDSAREIYRRITQEERKENGEPKRDEVDVVLVSVSGHRIELIRNGVEILEEKPPSLIFMEPDVVQNDQVRRKLLGVVLFGVMNGDKITYTGCPRLIKFNEDETDQVKKYLEKGGYTIKCRKAGEHGPFVDDIDAVCRGLQGNGDSGVACEFLLTKTSA